MGNIIIRAYDSSLQDYELKWTSEIQNNLSKRDFYSNPTLSFYTSMVYGFANHLPYSMDIEQPEYVPADFLNMMPYDVDLNQWFKFEDRRTFFNALIHWGDTFKTGMLLQMCNVFQKMILGQFPNDYTLTEEDYRVWGIDTMTKDKDYNRCFFETLKSLPDYYKELIAKENNEDRRKVLENMYNDIMNKIAHRFGGFKETDGNGNIVRESKGTIPIRPSKDVSMFVYWDDITFHDGIPAIIQEIKEDQWKSYSKFRAKDKYLKEESTPKKRLLKLIGRI